jgi:hypothetical protein
MIRNDYLLIILLVAAVFSYFHYNDALNNIRFYLIIFLLIWLCYLIRWHSVVEWNRSLVMLNQPLQRGGQAIPIDGQIVSTGNQGMTKGDKDMQDGNQDMPKGDKDMPKGDKDMQDGNQDMPKGDQVVPDGDQVKSILPLSPQTVESNQSSFIRNLVFTSNTGLDGFNGDRSSKYASFETDKAWGGNPDGRYFTYLEIKLPEYTHLTGILTGGYRGQDEWVTEYYLEYWDNYHEKWIKVAQIYKGNNNDSGVVYNQLDINTSALRIYPINWQKYPSLKVGLMGDKIEFLSCQYYQIQIKEGPEERREYYQNLYQKNCLKVDIQDYEKQGLEIQDMKTELNRLRVCLFQEKEKNLILNQNYCPREQLLDLARQFRQYRESTNS